MHRIFVYGTLKANENNAKHMTDRSHGKAVFVAKGRTSKRYPLVLIDFKELRNIPAMMFKEGLGHNVEGEIWDVDDKFLEWLDGFEGAGPIIYLRETLQVTHADSSGEDTCSVYVRYDDEISESSNFLSSYNSAECGRPYIVT